MRQLTTFTDPQQCQRLFSYLIVQGIHVEIHQEPTELGLWVKNEDQVDAAKVILQRFLADPQSQEFSGHERAAQQQLADEQARRERIARNTIAPGRDWRNSSVAGGTSLSQAYKSTPISMAVLTAGIAVFLLARKSGIDNYLYFLSPEDWRITETGLLPVLTQQLPWYEPWRFFTPVFLHFGIAHIIFNAMCLWNFARQVELRDGKLGLILVAAVSAAFSNTLQAIMVGPAFGGLSGIAYALIGFIWIRQLSPSGQGYFLQGSTLIFALVWFGLGILQEFQGVRGIGGNGMANYCHGGGLAAGMALGALFNLVTATPTRSHIRRP